MMITVVGLDLSLTSTGIARWEIDGADSARRAVTVTSKGRQGDTLATRHARLADLARRGWKRVAIFADQTPYGESGLADVRKAQDCAAQGRRNCATIEAPVSTITIECKRWTSGTGVCPTITVPKRPS